MAEFVDYYFSLNSPWTYMGHRRLADMAEHHGFAIRVHPVDFSGTIFPAIPFDPSINTFSFRPPGL